MAKTKEVIAGAETRLKKQLSKKIEPKQATKKEKANRLEETKKYIKSVVGELKKVHWSTRREVLVYTGVVLVTVVVVCLIIWVFDSLLSRVLQFVLK